MADPATWILEALRAASDRFGWAYGYRGSIFLIAGGLFILGVLMLVLIVQSALFGVPAKRDLPPGFTVVVREPAPPPPVPASVAAKLVEEATQRPQEAFRLGTRAGASTKARSLDSALDRFVEAGLGDPRIVSTSSHRKLVRVTACRTCDSAHGSAAHPPGCEYERGFLLGALGTLVTDTIQVRETSCRARGDRWCDYEVIY